MPTNTVIIPRATLPLATVGTIPSSKECSHLPLHRNVGASLSLAEMRRDVHRRIYESVAHIRQLVALEDEVSV